MTFGEKLDELIVKAGSSQGKLAAAVGSHQTVVSRWIRGEGEPNLRMVCKVADYFGVTVDSLIRPGKEVASQALPPQEQMILAAARGIGYDEAIRRLVIASGYARPVGFTEFPVDVPRASAPPDDNPDSSHGQPEANDVAPKGKRGPRRV